MSRTNLQLHFLFLAPKRLAVALFVCTVNPDRSPPVWSAQSSPPKRSTPPRGTESAVWGTGSYPGGWSAPWSGSANGKQLNWKKPNTDILRVSWCHLASIIRLPVFVLSRTSREDQSDRIQFRSSVTSGSGIFGDATRRMCNHVLHDGIKPRFHIRTAALKPLSYWSFHPSLGKKANKSACQNFRLFL